MKRQVFSFTIASGASTSDAVDLGASAWSYVKVQVGTMSTAVNLNVQASVDGGSTFYTLFHPTINSATVATNPVVISQSVGANGGVCGIPAEGCNRLRFVGTAVVSGGVAIKVICAE